MSFRALLTRVLKVVIVALLAVLVGVVAPLSETAAGQTGDQVSFVVKVGLLLDKSMSTYSNGVPQVTMDDLGPLLSLISEKGGELAVGAVHVDSRKPLIRLQVGPPPSAPFDSSAILTNGFVAGKAKIRYTKRMAEFTEQLSVWRQEAQSAVAAARPAIESLLTAPVADSGSDVYNALARLDRYLSESDAAWPTSPRKFALLCTDGEDTQKKAASIAMAEGVTVMVVPGTRLGLLASLHPKTFESPGAAIRYIVAVSKSDGTTSTQLTRN